ncbi:MAG: alpha/beta hydrolase [Solimonas sp.]
MRLLIALLTATMFLTGCSGPQLLNTFTPSDGYNLASNLPFDPTTGLTLDVYTPAGAKNAPVVVFFFGGRWTEGDKLQYKFVGQALASRGIVAVIPNYRLYPSVRFPAFVEDGARAVKWARANIGAYGGDGGKLFAMGHSAGAQIAAMLALNETYLKAVGGSRTWLKGMIGMAGPYNFLPINDPELRDIFGPPEKFEQSQPIFFVDGQNPPLLLLHGENDEIVWVSNTRTLANAVAAAGGPVETVIYPKMSHSLIVSSLGSVLRGSSDVINHVDDFVRRMAVYTRPAANTPIDIQAVPLELEIQTQPMPQ